MLPLTQNVKGQDFSINNFNYKRPGTPPIPGFFKKKWDADFVLRAIEFLWAGHGRVVSHNIREIEGEETAIYSVNASLETSTLNMEKIYTYKEGTLHIIAIDKKISQVWLIYREENKHRELGPYNISNK